MTPFTEVSRGAGQTSADIGSMNENVAQASQVSSEIANDISIVNAVSEDISSKGTRIKQSAGQLKDLSSKLKNMISVFKVTQKNAHGPEDNNDD